MRIISGKWKGHHLVSFKADHIRPTTDRVKETLCNRWQAYFEGARVLDLFAGTGNLSFESLSRGAAYVTCVELNKSSLEIIKSNQKKLKAFDHFEIKAMDVFKFLKTFDGPPYDLILIDPPFTEKKAHSVMEALCQSKTFSTTTLVTIESSRHERLDEAYEPFTLEDRREYGDKNLSFFEILAPHSQA